jgi:hypothetical protein
MRVASTTLFYINIEKIKNIWTGAVSKEDMNLLEKDLGDNPWLPYRSRGMACHAPIHDALFQPTVLFQRHQNVRA